MCPPAAGTAGCAVGSCGRVFLPPEIERLPHISRRIWGFGPRQPCTARCWLAERRAGHSGFAAHSRQNGSYQPRALGLHHRVRALPPSDADQVPRLQSRRYGDFRVLDFRLLPSLDAYPQETIAPSRRRLGPDRKSRRPSKTIPGRSPIRETIAQCSSNCFHTLHLPVRNDSIRTCVH